MIGIVVIWTFISLCKKKSMHSTSLFDYFKRTYIQIYVYKSKNMEERGN